MDTVSILREDAKAIYIGNLSTVDSDLVLPAEGKSGSTIVWESDRPHVVGADGKVRRPHAGTGDREVILTACLSLDGETLERTFKLTVLAKEQNWTAARLLPTQVWAFSGEPVRVPPVVVAEKVGGGFVSMSAEWGQPSDMDASNADAYIENTDTDVYSTGARSDYNTSAVRCIKGTPPIDKQPELIPEAIIHRSDKREEPLERRLSPFAPGSVRVSGDIFAENARRMLDYLLSVNDDSMLYNFREAAGLDTKGAAPLTGWDAPECLLKGHTTGHYLSALALAVCQGEKTEALKQKIRYMISGLGECQNAMAESGRFREGFLSGYSEEQFDLLEQYVTYPNIWAPYYTLHKIMAGLLDCYECIGETGALSIAEKLGIWVYNRLRNCGEDKRRKMWSMYIAGEYGGMNEAMARLYGLSPKPEYIQAASFFDNDLLLYPMERNIDTLAGIHANQHIPQMIGALEIFAQTNERRYYDAAYNFWRIAVSDHAYSIGGVGEGEMFREAGRIAALLTDKTAESCASYNMLKLTERLFRYAADLVMADYYERTLYNHIVATHDQSGPTGGSTYFMPLLPGGKREFDTDGNSCCHGTGLESHFRYHEMIYHFAKARATEHGQAESAGYLSESETEDALYVNLFIPSVLDWSEKGIKITQTDGYLERQFAEFIVEGEAGLELRLRIPGWLDEKPRLLINGAEAAYAPQNGYAVIKRLFKNGDRIVWHTPFAICFEPAPDDPNVGSLLYGPLVMGADCDETGMITVDGQASKRAGESLTLDYGGFTFRPFFMLWNRPNHVYVRRA